jgi:hypothetical protein
MTLFLIPIKHTVREGSSYLTWQRENWTQTELKGPPENYDDAVPILIGPSEQIRKYSIIYTGLRIQISSIELFTLGLMTSKGQELDLW